ncbi:MAG: SUMF1/EgtB/PvdO family nonheme iron enzyme, partial [Planctomycetota bacterium]
MPNDSVQICTLSEVFSSLKAAVAPLAVAQLVLATAIWTPTMGRAQEPTVQKRSVETTSQVTWIRIPAGRFMMGSGVSAKQVAKDFAEYGRNVSEFEDEQPRHLVEITKPFFMSSTEVTVGQFRAFIEDSGYKTRSEVDTTGGWGFDPVSRQCIGRDPRFSWKDPVYAQTDNHPVV